MRYDSILMLSGGKDSTYLAYMLEQQGARPLAITVDVGFMSSVAKENIERVKDDLHIDHLWVTSQQGAHAKVISQFRERADWGLVDVCGGCTFLSTQTVLNIALDLGVKRVVCGFTKYSAFVPDQKVHRYLPGGLVHENPYMQWYDLPKMERFLAGRGFVTDPTLTNCKHIREIIMTHEQRFGANPYEKEFGDLLAAGQIDEAEMRRLRSWCSSKHSTLTQVGDQNINAEETSAKKVNAEETGDL